MKNEIFLDEIDDESGAQALHSAIDIFQENLPSGSYICGCIHKLKGVVRAHLYIFVNGEPYRIDWSGRHLTQLAQFIEGNLAPILRTWRRSLPEFFQGLSFNGEGRGLPCRQKDCTVYQRMKKKSTISKDD